MEGLDLSNILDEHDLSMFDDEQDNTSDVNDTEENNKEETTEVDPDNLFDGEPESVGSEENGEKEDTKSENISDGSSPNFYSSIAEAFVTDGIFPDLDYDAVKNVKTAEDFVKVTNEYIKSQLTEQQRRVSEALELDADTAAIRQFEGNLNFLNSINDDIIRAEDERGEDLRKRLIYQDFINRGFSKERAEKEVNKSINNGNDIDDAIEALDGLKKFYKSGYDNYLQSLRDAEAQRVQALKERTERIKDVILNNKNKVFGDIDLDKNTRQKMFDSVAKPIYKDKDTGEMLNAVQKYARDNEEDFWVKMSFLYTMTDGFKSLDKLVGNKVKKAYKKSLSDLEGKINATSRNSDGNLEFVSGIGDKVSFGNGITLAI